MSIRQKTACLSLLSLLIVYGFYFREALAARAAGAGLWDYVWLLVAAIVVSIIVEVVGAIVIAVTARGALDAPMDERERMFDGRAMRVGYHVLFAGVMLVISTALYGATRADMVNAMVLAICLSELARYASFLSFHRAG